MVELVVVSGKGGTGKTSVTAALASSLRLPPSQTVLVDCDVDAADLFLVLTPEPRKIHAFISGTKATLDHERCSQCLACRNICRFGAISADLVIDPVKCEGCGACMLMCRSKAITLKDNIAGEWYLSDTRFGPLVHAKLGVAQDNSGKLVATIRSAARDLAASIGSNLILVDGPPGIGCPVISSISGASALLVVTEPSPSGIHDLERLCRLAATFRVRSFVCINKFDIHHGNTAAIEQYCRDHGLPVIGRVPYSKMMNTAQNLGKNIFELAQTYPEAQGLIPHFEELQQNVIQRLFEEKR